MNINLPNIPIYYFWVMSFIAILVPSILSSILNKRIEKFKTLYEKEQIQTEKYKTLWEEVKKKEN